MPRDNFSRLKLGVHSIIADNAVTQHTVLHLPSATPPGRAFLLLREASRAGRGGLSSRLAPPAGGRATAPPRPPRRPTPSSLSFWTSSAFVPVLSSSAFPFASPFSLGPSELSRERSSFP